jgi:ribosomal protein S21
VPVIGADVESALKSLRKLVVFTGAWREVQRSGGGRFGGFIGPAERRRIKSLRARKRQSKAARRDHAHTAMLDWLGLDDRPRRRAAA